MTWPMALLFRLCDEDRAKYGGPERVRFDSDALADVPYDVQRAWEKDIQAAEKDPTITIARIISTERENLSALGIKGMIWLARQMAGVAEPGFGAFAIRHLKATYSVEEDPAPGGDVDPPVPSTPASSAAGRSKRR